MEKEERSFFELIDLQLTAKPCHDRGYPLLLSISAIILVLAGPAFD